MLPSGLRAIEEIFLRFSKANVKDLLLKRHSEKDNERPFETKTYFTRSNTDTRLPTGLYNELPSGVNSIFPCLYTVPHMLEN